VKVAFNYNNLAGLCFEKKQLEEAAELYGKAMDILKKAHGENNFYVAGVCFNRGNVFMKQGRHEEALAEYFKAIKIEGKVKGKNDTGLLDVYKAVGIVYSELNNWTEALKFQKKALKLAKASHESCPNDIATLHYQIGCSYHEQEETKKALDFFQKASVVLGNEKDKLGAALHFGQRYYRLGRLGRDLVDNLQVLTIETDCESETAKVADFLVDTHRRAAAIYSKHGQLEKSIEYLENARKICVKGLKGNDLLIAEIYRRLGEIYMLQGQREKALGYQRVSRKLMEKK